MSYVFSEKKFSEQKNLFIKEYATAKFTMKNVNFV